jgi:formylglycine-generating enzyme required for sulfatase activity/tRNA A-37 threonylcarbamoyl transferase component Bud32
MAAVEDTVKSLFFAALEKEPAERTSFLDTACQGNDDLRRRIEALLHAAEAADPLLDRPAAYHLQNDGPTPPEQRTPLPTGPFVGPLAAMPTGMSSPGTQPSGDAGTAVPQLPGYAVLGVLGRGGMGIVYKAQQLALRRDVALKMVLHGDYADENARRRFRTEAQTIAQLAHPHIVQIYEVGEHNGLPYFSLEHCAGGSLEQQLDGTPWAPQRAAALVETLARAIHAAHQAGLVHRDLKPGNVLLTEDGTAKISDFGLVKRLDVSGDTGSGMIVGTPEYMAPEQAGGKSKTVGPGADIYALGALLYELLTGRPPFKAANRLDTLLQVLSDEPVPVRRLQPKTPRDIDTICLKCLEKQPARRYAKALDLADDLRRFLNQEPIQARPTGLLERAVKWVRRQPVIAGLLTLVVLTTAGCIAAFAWAYKDASERLQQVLAEQQQRVLAQVDQLRKAAPEEVHAILADLRKHPEVLPRLRQLWQQQDQPEQGRMRVGLALVSEMPQEVAGPLLNWMLRAKDPREVVLARDALLPATTEQKAELWRQVEGQDTPAEVRFRALVALAAFDLAGPGWQKAGEAAVAQLLVADPLHLGTWTEALRPAAAALVTPLSDVFRGKKLAERRLVAANVLAAYIALDPRAVADLAADADVEQLAVLRPLLLAHQAKVVGLLESELAPLTADWQDAPLDPAWGGPAAQVAAEIERAGGLIAERFAMCQTLPADRVAAVVDGLQKSGYRPTRLRPYRAAGKLQAALVWTRDGGAVRCAMGLSVAALMELDTELGRAGWVPEDVAAYRQPDEKAVRYAGLWRRGGKGEEAVVLSLPEMAELGHTRGTAQEEAKKKGTVPATVQSLARANEGPLFCGLRRQGTQWGALRTSDRTPTAREVFPDRLPLDVDISEAVGWAPVERGSMVGWLGALQQGSLTAVPWAWPGPVDHCSYATVWQQRPDRQAERVVGLDTAAHAARMHQLAAAGWRPVAVSVAEVPTGWWGEGRLRTASLWHRPKVPEAARLARAPRQANAAALLLSLGKEGPVWPLLKQVPTPDVRSHVLARLGTHGIAADTIVRRLKVETDATARRALILGLGELGDKDLPAEQRNQLLPLLLKWYREEADAGVHGAIDWLLRHGKEGPAQRKVDWAAAKELDRIDRELRGLPAGGRQWFVNGQGQTYTIVPGPVDFLMGTPVDEPLHIADLETQHRRHIGRSYAIATKAVTVADFEQFLKDCPQVKAGGNTPYNPEPACPLVGVSWFDALQYCRWLSEKEGMTEEQMCCPSIDEIEKCKNGKAPMHLPLGYLERTGYRLPTEAEWEHACRAQTTTAWSCGGSEELLGRYALYWKNSRDRTWPVGQKRPNDLGLFDMHGNVWQWCQTYIWPYNAAAMEDKEDIEYDKDTYDILDKYERPCRGGAFNKQARELRAGYRVNDGASYRSQMIGVRLARTYR